MGLISDGEGRRGRKGRGETYGSEIYPSMPPKGLVLVLVELVTVAVVLSLGQ